MTSLYPYIGPPYCPVKNVPSPYDDTLMPSDEDTGIFDPKEKTRPSSEKTPPPRTTTTQYASQYPPLPTASDVNEGLTNGGQQQQQYPHATYPGQNEYQRRGVAYNNSDNETTRLINN